MQKYFFCFFLKAVIWGLRKLHHLTYKKAELKWKQGFKSTKEELIKRKCNEILNKFSNRYDLLNKNNNNVNDKQENGDNYYEESEYNEDDTSFFTYCSNTNINNNNNDTAATNKDVDKTFNETVEMLNDNNNNENIIDDKENLEVNQDND